MVSQFIGSKDFPLHGTYLQKILQILTYVFDWLYFTQCLTSFFSIDHLLYIDAQFFILFHLTDVVLSTSPCANVFVFGDFNFHHKDWLTYSGGTTRFGKLCYNFSISNNLTWMVDFPTGSLIVILTVQIFWIYLFLLELVFVLQWLSLHWEILIMLFQFPLTFHQINNGMPHFIV